MNEEVRKVVSFLKQNMGNEVSFNIREVGSILGKVYYWVGVIDLEKAVIINGRVLYSDSEVREEKYVVVEKDGTVRWAGRMEEELLSGAKNLEFIADEEFMKRFVERFSVVLRKTKNIWETLKRMMKEFDVYIVFEIRRIERRELKGYLSFIKGEKGLLVMPLLRELRQPSIEIDIEAEPRIDLESGNILVELYIRDTFSFLPSF